jgi:hypothetical protein
MHRHRYLHHRARGTVAALSSRLRGQRRPAWRASVPLVLLNQLELQLEELEASATEDELAAEMRAAKTTKVASFTRKRPSRKPFPGGRAP